MWEAFSHNLKDPAGAAVPFFLLHRPTYGLTHPVGTYNVWQLQYDEYVKIWHDVRRAPRWRDRLAYVFGPPGWAPRD